MIQEEEREEKGENSKGIKKTEGQSKEEEATQLGKFDILPIELWQMILRYVPFPDILGFISVNRCFYELITGYDKVGLVGVENRPKPLLYSGSWIIDKDIDFYENKFN